MARKRAAKRKNASKRKQSRRTNSADANADADNNQHHFVPIEEDDNDDKSNKGQGSREADKGGMSTGSALPQATKADKSTSVRFTSPPPDHPFFSPPAADLTSLQAPQARPIHTPYSKRRDDDDDDESQQQQDQDDEASNYSYASSSSNSYNHTNNRSGTPSGSSEGRTPSSTGSLSAQVRDLNTLLTSPLVLHLGDLAGGAGPSTLGALDDEDDMSDEWEQLAQSESMLRQELESFDIGAPNQHGGLLSSPEASRNSTTNTRTDATSSVPPAIARQRLDPLTSPIHPFNLFPHTTTNATTTEEESTLSPTAQSTVTVPTSNTRFASSQRQVVGSPPRSYVNKYQESDDIAANMQAALQVGVSSMDDASEKSLDETILSGTPSRSQQQHQPHQQASPNMEAVMRIAAAWKNRNGKLQQQHPPTTKSPGRLEAGLQVAAARQQQQQARAATSNSKAPSITSSEQTVAQSQDNTTTTETALQLAAKGGGGSSGEDDESGMSVAERMAAYSKISDSYSSGDELSKDIEAALQMAVSMNHGSTTTGSSSGDTTSNNSDRRWNIALQSQRMTKNDNDVGIGLAASTDSTIDAALESAVALNRSSESSERIVSPPPRAAFARNRSTESETTVRVVNPQHASRQSALSTGQQRQEVSSSVSASAASKVASGNASSRETAVGRRERYLAAANTGYLGVTSGFVMSSEEKKAESPENPPAGEDLDIVGGGNGSSGSTEESQVEMGSDDSDRSAAKKFQTPVLANVHPNTRGSSGANSRNHTAIQSGRLGDHDNDVENNQYADLGRQLDRLVNSQPGFSPREILSDLELSTPGRRRTRSSDQSSIGSAPDFIDPEISQLVHAVQEQLDQTSTLTDDTTPSLQMIIGHIESNLDASQSRTSPEISEGFLDVSTAGEPEKPKQYQMKNASVGEVVEAFLIGAINSAEFENDDDEDDNLGQELDQLETAQYALRQALTEASVGDVKEPGAQSKGNDIATSDDTNMQDQLLVLQSMLADSMKQADEKRAMIKRRQPKASPTLKSPASGENPRNDLVDQPRSLPQKRSLTSPTKSPPRFTDDILYNKNIHTSSIAQPVAMLPRPHTPRSPVISPQSKEQSAAPTTATAATSMMTEENANSRQQNNVADDYRDLNYYHARDPEPRMSFERSTSSGSSGSDDETRASSQYALKATTSTGTISTIANLASSSTIFSEKEKEPYTPNKSGASGGQHKTSTKYSPGLRFGVGQELSPVSKASSLGSSYQLVSPEDVKTRSTHSRQTQSGQVSPEPYLHPPSSTARSRRPTEGHPPSSTARSRRPAEDDDHSSTSSTSTPQRKGKGVSVSSPTTASCTALNHLVRTPSGDSTGVESSSKPFQFVEEGGSFDSDSVPMVPLAPEEWAARNTHHEYLYEELTAMHEIDEVVKSKSGSMSSERGSSGDNTKLTYVPVSPPHDLAENVSVLAYSRVRQQQYEYVGIKRDDSRQKETTGSPTRKTSNGSVKHMSPSTHRHLQNLERELSLSTSLQDNMNMRGASYSPTRRIVKKKSLRSSGGKSPSSVKSADARMIKAIRSGDRADSRDRNSPYFDLGYFQPSQGQPSSISSVPSGGGSPKSRQTPKKSPSRSTRPKASVDASSSRTASDDGREPLDAVDVEDPDLKRLLDQNESSQEDAKSKKSRRRCWCFVISLVWILLLGLVVLLTFLFLRGPTNSNESATGIESSTANGTTMTPSNDQANEATVVPATAVPTIDVSMAPSPQPTLPPTIRPTLTAVTFPSSTTNPTPRPSLPPTPPPTGSLTFDGATLSLVSLLIQQSVDNGAALLDRTSPEYASLLWLVDNTMLDRYSDAQKVQRFVLGTIYYSMGGDRWTENDKWMTDADECRWFSRARRAPACNADGEYVNLELGYLDASGTIPKAIGMLSNSLERLDIEGGPTTFITGTIPSELGHLSLMREFRLSDNEISGTIPSDFRRWNFLETLDLKGNNLRGSLPFDHPFWPSLTDVDLGENYFIGSIPTDIGRQEMITKLFLQDNLLSGSVPSEIGKLYNLRDLYLDQNNLDFFPTEIGRLGQLETLKMAANTLKSVLPSEIGLMTKLRTLSFTFNELRGAIPSELGLLVHLRDRIDLSYNKLTGFVPTEIGELIRMKHLLLQSNELSGTLPEEVASLHRLNTLRIDDNQMSGTVADEICEVFNQTLPYFYADCEEIDCPCCIFCCKDNDGCACRFKNTFDQYLCY